MKYTQEQVKSNEDIRQNLIVELRNELYFMRTTKNRRLIGYRYALDGKGHVTRDLG